MTDHDLDELGRRLGAAFARAAAPPAPSLADRMIIASVSHPQAIPGGTAWRRWWRVALAASGAAVLGLALSLIVGGGGWLGTGSDTVPPVQRLCETSGTNPPDDCVSVSQSLPAVDLSLGGWTHACIESSCFDEGTRALLLALPNLGDEYLGPRDAELGASGSPLRIEFRASQIGLAWQAGERGGVSATVSLDLTQLALGTGPAFVMIGDPTMSPAASLEAFEIPERYGEMLLSSFFTPVE